MSKVEEQLSLPGARVVAAYEAALAVAMEVTPDAVLQRIVDGAREVVGARYGALGVADQSGRLLQFITSGLTAAEREAIGPPPEGHGLIGALIRDGTPLLVPDLQADPRSSGFPPNHPPMKSLLGTPIKYGDRVLGDLYLTDKLDGSSFDEEDLAAIQILAAHAATAIDRSQLYRQARQQRDRLRTILDSLPSGVIILSAKTERVQFANAAFIALALGGAAPPGVLPIAGRDYTLTRVDGVALEPADRPELRALAGELVQHQQLTLLRTDGSSVPVSVQAAPLRGPDNEVAEAVLVFQDVTQLRQAEQLKDDFLSLISHEFRTPLTAIHGGAHVLAESAGSLDAETRTELLHDIVAESDRLDRMLKNLLSLAAVMAGRLTAETEPVLLAPLARAVAVEVGNRSPRHELAVELPAGLPPVEGDPSLIAQVLRNLYENAVKYSPAGGRILTTGRAAEQMVEVAVSDQGQGIAREHLRNVFERFHRAGADPTVRGMGLGLYLSRFLVEAQHGYISVHSPGPGLGTTFTVSLPIAGDWEPEEPSLPGHSGVTRA
jgi:signal transduction histidine kinase